MILYDVCVFAPSQLLHHSNSLLIAIDLYHIEWKFAGAASSTGPDLYSPWNDQASICRAALVTTSRNVGATSRFSPTRSFALAHDRFISWAILRRHHRDLIATPL